MILIISVLFFTYILNIMKLSINVEYIILYIIMLKSNFIYFKLKLLNDINRIDNCLNIYEFFH